MVVNRDFTPLFRTTIGFDRMADILDSLIPDQVPSSAYPPYNIEKVDDHSYCITMAVAGFSVGDLEVLTQENRLVVRGRTLNDDKHQEREFLHRGIAERAFEKQFSLADNVKVLDAHLENGILSIELEREIPESEKPRKIAITTSGNATEVKSLVSEKKKLTISGS